MFRYNDKIRLIIILFFLYNISLSANNTYYEHRVSQYKILSQQKDKFIAMLGDSLTDRGLWNELTNRCDIVNRGINGDDVKGVLHRLDALNSSIKQVFIMIGVNDILRGKSVNYVFTNYKKILINLYKKKITPIVQSCLYIGKDTPPTYNKKIKRLNSLLIKYTQKNNIAYINLNQYLAPNGYLSKKYTLDNLHLNGRAYLIWQNAIKKQFIDAK